MITALLKHAAAQFTTFETAATGQVSGGARSTSSSAQVAKQDAGCQVSFDGRPAVAWRLGSSLAQTLLLVLKERRHQVTDDAAFPRPDLDSDSHSGRQVHSLVLHLHLRAIE